MDHLQIKKQIERITKVLSQSPVIHDGFLGGKLGLLYYYYHAGIMFGSNDYLEESRLLLETVFRQMNSNEGTLVGSSLSTGGAGFAYITSYLQKAGFIDFDTEGEFEELDDLLFQTAIEQIEQDNIDYLHGAAGIIYYFSSRDQSKSVNGYLTTLVNALVERVVLNDHGIWFRNTVWQEEQTNERIDFSLSHGLSGILLILIETYPLIQHKKDCRKIIEEGIRFIARHELPVDFSKEEYSSFPCTMHTQDEEIFRINRLAWCYGDLNHVLLFYKAGILFKDDRYLSLANRIGLRTFERKSVTSTLCTDSHFCHGTSGLAQLYKSLYQISGNWLYRNAYEYWINHTVSILDGELENKKYEANPISLLEGFTGVAFVLSDFLADYQTNWAKIFLL